jgi:predicted DNA-binding transcriptional regulator AlpA
MNMAEFERVSLEIRNAIQPSLDAYRVQKISEGAKTIDHDQVCELLGCGNTRLDELIKDGRFSRALYIGNKRVWLDDEVLLAKAEIIAEDSAAALKREAAKTLGPMNRYERRKAAKACS